jgi:hypothetical protein
VNRVLKVNHVVKVVCVAVWILMHIYPIRQEVLHQANEINQYNLGVGVQFPRNANIHAAITLLN